MRSSGPFAAAGALLVGALLLGACGPALGEAPFACASEGEACPEGYRCEAQVCVAEGASLEAARVLRVTYVNLSGLAWFPSSQRGATLLVHDGFTPGAQAVYEIEVDEAGRSANPVILARFGDTSVSSAFAELDDDRYAMATLEFPEADGDALQVGVRSLPRARSGAATSTLYSEEVPFLGGYEPSFVSLVRHNDALWLAFADASEGGSIALRELSLSGELLRTASLPLPPGIAPFSADCALFVGAEGELLLRVGLRSTELMAIDVDADPIVGALVPSLEGDTLFADAQSLVRLESTSDPDDRRLVVRDREGVVRSEAQHVVPQGVDPYVGVSSPRGALVAPLDVDARGAFSVVAASTDGSITELARVEPPGDDDVYTARALEHAGRVFVAWASFHGQLVDVWLSAEEIAP